MDNHASEPKHLPLALFFLRLSVFVVFFVWTLDKFVRPEHAGGVYKAFYFLPLLSGPIFVVIGIAEMILIFAFLFSIKKKLTYGAILLFQFISTVSCFRQFLAPFEQINILLYSGWPLLAGCFALYVLRDCDILFTVPAK